MSGWFTAYFPGDYNLTNYWGGDSLPAGSLGLDPGISVGALKLTGDGEGDYGPFIDVFTIPRITDGSWGSPPVVTPHVRIGKLSGVLGGVVGEWGMAAGDDLSDETPGTRSIVASTTGIRLKNADLMMYKGVNQTVAIAADGTMKLGTNVGADSTTTFMHSPTTGNLRVGPQVSGKPNLFWNNATGSLSLRQNTTEVITLRADGTSYFERDMRLGVNGGIWQGSSGTFASPRGGWKLWRDGSNKGRFTTYDNSGNVQIDVDSGGRLIAGEGSVRLSKRGMEFVEGYAVNPQVTFTSGEKYYGYIQYVRQSGGYYTATFALNGNRGQGGLTIQSDINNIYASAVLYADNYDSGKYCEFRLDSARNYARLQDADMFIETGGVAIGYQPPTPLNRGVFVADIGGEHNSPHIVLKDTGNIAHGMTDVASTETYANFRKADNDAGGLLINGLGENALGLRLNGWGVGGDSNINTTGRGTVYINGAKRDGAGPSTKALGTDEIILGVGNYGSARFFVVGNGNYHYDGTGSAYDDHDDVGLLRTLSREIWEGTIDSVWDRFITTNRQNLIDAGIISDGGFINGAALNRLLTGAIWQLNERLTALEGRAS